MNAKIAVGRDVDGYGARGECNGVCKSDTGQVTLEFASEFDDLGVNEVHHSGMERQLQEVEIAEQYLVEKPWQVADESEPCLEKPLRLCGLEEKVRR